MTTTGAPRWLELQLDGDYCLWQMQQIRDHLEALGRPKSPIDALVDQATGRQAQLEAAAVELMQQFEAIQAEMQGLLAASDSPPGAVGLGLVPPGPNPTGRGAE